MIAQLCFKGLSFMLSMMPRWIYRQGETEGSPLDALRFEKPLAQLKERLASGEKVFEQLLTKLIVDNPHRSTVELQPDTTLADKITAEEEERLASVKAQMSPEEIEQAKPRSVSVGVKPGRQGRGKEEERDQ